MCHQHVLARSNQGSENHSKGHTVVVASQHNLLTPHFFRHAEVGASADFATIQMHVAASRTPQGCPCHIMQDPTAGHVVQVVRVPKLHMQRLTPSQLLTTCSLSRKSHPIASQPHLYVHINSSICVYSDRLWHYESQH